MLNIVSRILVSWTLLVTFIALSGCAEDLTRGNLYKSSNVNTNPDVQVGTGSDSPAPSSSPGTNPGGEDGPGSTPAPNPSPTNSPSPDDDDDEPGTGNEGEPPQPSQTPLPTPTSDPEPGSCELEVPAITLLSSFGKAFKASGNGGTMQVNGDIHVNSSDAHAVSVLGKDVTVAAKKVSVVGGIKIGPRARLVASEVLKGASVLEDPLKDLAAPDCSQLPIRSSKRLRVNSVMTLEPGRYLGGIFIKRGGDVTMNAGIYCLMGGGLRVHRGKLSGEGVMIYNSTRIRHHMRAIDIKKGAVVNLSGIKDCNSPYHGITIFQDRSHKGRNIRLASGQLSIQGMIYSPNSKVNVRVDKGGNAHPFSQLIARKLRLKMHLGLVECDQEGEHSEEADD